MPVPVLCKVRIEANSFFNRFRAILVLILFFSRGGDLSDLLPVILSVSNCASAGSI
jgi:hypothetical protein